MGWGRNPIQEQRDRDLVVSIASKGRVTHDTRRSEPKKPAPVLIQRPSPSLPEVQQPLLVTPSYIEAPSKGVVFTGHAMPSLREGQDPAIKGMFSNSYIGFVKPHSDWWGGQFQSGPEHLYRFVILTDPFQGRNRSHYWAIPLRALEFGESSERCMIERKGFNYMLRAAVDQVPAPQCGHPTIGLDYEHIRNVPLNVVEKHLTSLLS